MMLNMSSSSLQAFGGFHNLAEISARSCIKMQSSGTRGGPNDDGGGDDGKDDDSINSDLSLLWMVRMRWRMQTPKLMTGNGSELHMVWSRCN
jgi:hypothetical protein